MKSVDSLIEHESVWNSVNFFFKENFLNEEDLSFEEKQII